MKNHYESVFILTPVLSESQMKDTVEKFTNLVNNNGGEVIHQENWGLKKLAYTIEHKSTGFYQLIQFTAEPEFIKILETEFRREERIIRFLTTRFDKHAIIYNERRRKGEFNKKEEPKKEVSNNPLI